MTYENAYNYEVTWLALADSCPLCQTLNNQTWTIDTLEGIVNHPEIGPVYDLDVDISLTHEHCRCLLIINPQVDLEQTEFYRQLQSALAGEGEVPSNLEEIKTKIDEINDKFQIGSGSIRQWEFAIIRLGHNLEKLGLGKDFDAAIKKIIQTIMLLRQLQLMIYAYEAAMGPLGWAYFGVTATTVTVATVAEVS